MINYRQLTRIGYQEEEKNTTKETAHVFSSFIRHEGGINKKKIRIKIIDKKRKKVHTLNSTCLGMTRLFVVKLGWMNIIFRHDDLFIFFYKGVDVVINNYI